MGKDDYFAIKARGPEKGVQGLYFSPLPLNMLQELYPINSFTKTDGNLYGSFI